MLAVMVFKWILEAESWGQRTWVSEISFSFLVELLWNHFFFWILPHLTTKMRLLTLPTGNLGIRDSGLWKILVVSPNRLTLNVFHLGELVQYSWMVERKEGGMTFVHESLCRQYAKMCMHAYVCACVHVCVPCVCALCVCACVCVHVSDGTRIHPLHSQVSDNMHYLVLETGFFKSPLTSLNLLVSLAPSLSYLYILWFRKYCWDFMDRVKTFIFPLLPHDFSPNYLLSLGI